ATVILELCSGTFYLLMIAIGLTSGALAALLGFGMATQTLLAALVGTSLVWPAATRWATSASDSPVIVVVTW
ncbi:MAG: hypothetical protein K2Y33_11045, partial [Mycolicibacterium frederiksbergense]|nr:hypothetical protein [Mycolicibacterium frederiksbergense]